MSGPSDALRRLRCAVVTPYATLGGAERWLLDLLDHSDRVDAQVLLLQDGPLRAELQARGVPTEVLPTGADARSIAERSWRLARTLRASDADVVLASGVKAAAVAVPACRWVGLPVVWAKHDFSWDRTLARPLGAAADGVIAISAAVAGATRRSDVLVVPPPRPQRVETDRSVARAQWAAWGHPVPEDLTLAVVGRLIPYKGIDTTIRALAESGNRWSLVVVGPPDPASPAEGHRLRALASSLGVASRVRFVPEVPDAGRWLAAFDAVAVLTRRDPGGAGREGYSIVALEALAAGVPLVGAAGNPEVERMAGVAGVVVPPEDPAAVARALAHLEDADHRRTLGARGRRSVADHPDAAATAARITTFLAGVARRPGAGLVGPPVTVLTCMRNEEGHVDGVIGEVLGQLRDRDEYLLVDDRSTDGTAAEIARWADRDARLTMLRGPGVNLAAARNHGFRAATNDVVACTDAGCRPGPAWLRALAAPFAEPSPADLVVGVFTVPGGSRVQDAFTLAGFPSVEEARRRSPFVRAFGRLFGRAFSADRLDGRSMAVTREAWSAVGGFDESLDSSEDAAFGHAVLASGARSVLALDAVVAWEQPPHLGELASTFARYGEWGARAHDWRLVRRDLVRAVSYAAAPAAFLRAGASGRAALVGAGIAYLSLPVARAVRTHAGPSTIALIPAVLVVKDLAKAWGCCRGLSAAVGPPSRSLTP